MNDEAGNRAIRQHAPPLFAVDGDELVVGALRVTELARRVGRTPFYAYDRNLITGRVRELRRVLPAQVKLHYAMKANPMPDVVNHLSGLVDGLDVASAGELKIALASGITPREISFAGPGKRDDELVAAVRAGILVNVESQGEIERLARAARFAGSPARVAVRVNPDFELKSSGMRMGGGPKPFGIDAEQVPQALDAIGRLGLAFEGFHIFSGSQNLRVESISEAQSKSVELAIRLAANAPAPVRVVNIGGGLGIPYFPGEQRLAVDAIGHHLSTLVPIVERALPDALLVIELGRYLVGEAGVYVSRIVDRKVSRGHVFLVVDGGLHQHLAASGNFGQVLRKNYPVAIANRMREPATEVASIVGPLCTPLDVLADHMALPRAEVGDLVAVFQSGAYGLTASPLGFLSHPPPAEILV